MNLQQWVLNLPSPDNYHAGRRFHRTGYPDNILLFSRASGNFLARNANRNHHHRYLLIVSLLGSGTLILNQKPVRLQSSSAVLIHPLQFHHYTDMEQDNICWLFLTFEGGNPSDFESWKDQAVPLDARANTLLSLLAEIWHPHQPFIQGSEQTPLLIALLLLHLAGRAGLCLPPTKPASTGTLLHSVEQWLRKTPAEQWNVTSLSRALGHSERHLRRQFKQQTNIGIGRFLQEQKAIQAMTILRAGGRVSDAAAAAGYESLYVFSRAFRRMFGVSPSQYRRGSP